MCLYLVIQRRLQLPLHEPSALVCGAPGEPSVCYLDHSSDIPEDLSVKQSTADGELCRENIRSRDHGERSRDHGERSLKDSDRPSVRDVKSSKHSRVSRTAVIGRPGTGGGESRPATGVGGEALGRTAVRRMVGT